MISKNYKENLIKTLVLAFPVMLGQFGHIMVGVVDTAMVGLIGTNQQAAIALASSVYTIILVFGLGISFGVTPLVAEADSQKDFSKNTALLKHSIIINLIWGVSICLLMTSLSFGFKLLDQEPKVVSLAIPFFNVLMLSIIPMSLYAGLKQFCEGLSDTRMAMYISVGTNILNVLLNYVLIFGKYGFPEMGMIGAAWASFFSRVVMAIGMLGYIRYSERYRNYWKDLKLSKSTRKTFYNILSIGVPTGLQWVFEIGAFSFAVVMIGWISPTAQAAHQIAVSLAAVTYMISTGISAATSVRVANQFGLSSKTGIKTAAYSGIILTTILMSCCTLFYILFQKELPAMFSNSDEVIAIATLLIIIVAFFQISDGIQSVELGILRGIKDVKTPTIITFIAYWIIGLPSGYILGFNFQLGAEGVWYGLALGLLSSAVLLHARFSWMLNKMN